MVTFNCKAITNAITILPNGKIAPCCVIKENYSKPIESWNDTQRFADLKVEGTPSPCSQCVKYPKNSYKSFFDKFGGPNLQYLDFRNSNICNLKCRTCGPHSSSTWAAELNLEQPIIKTDVSDYLDQIINDGVREIYFAGGEPLLNADHWKLLIKLIELNLCNKISLMYTTNLTITKYKDLDIFEIWKKFRKVKVYVSVDAVGLAFNYIRSGANWETVDKNINYLLNEKKVDLSLAYTLSVISVWFLPDVLSYAKEKKINVNIFQLTDPHYFTLNVLPDALVEKCVDVLNKCKQTNPEYTKKLDLAISTARTNDDQGSFVTLINNILLSDKIRSESLFDLLPFKEAAIEKVFQHQ